MGGYVGNFLRWPPVAQLTLVCPSISPSSYTTIYHEVIGSEVCMLFPQARAQGKWGSGSGLPSLLWPSQNEYGVKKNSDIREGQHIPILYSAPTAGSATNSHTMISSGPTKDTGALSLQRCLYGVARLAESRQLSTFGLGQKRVGRLGHTFADLMTVVHGLRAALAITIVLRVFGILLSRVVCWKDVPRITTIEHVCSVMVVHDSEPTACYNCCLQIVI